MFGWIKNIHKSIKELNFSVDKYKSESIVESLPTVACVNRAKKLIDKKKYDEAESILKEALDISNQDALVYKYLGKIYEQKTNYKDATDNYEKSAQLNSNDKEIWLRLGMCLLNSKKYNEALSAFEKADKVAPFNTDVYTGWGMVLMKLKKYALARDKFATASQISKYNFTSILLSAIMDIKLNDLESAEVKLKFLSKVAPNESSTYEYSRLKLLKSDYDGAEKYAKKSIEINKQMLPAYFILGEVYSIKKDKDKTEQIFKSALNNDLDCSNLHVEWGKAYVRFFEFEKAKEQFIQAQNTNENSEDAKICLALTNAYEGDFALTDELKIRNASNVYIQESIGLKNLKENKPEDAIEMFKKALKTDSKQTYNYYNMVRAYKILNNNDKIREYYEKFTSENPEYTEGFVDYGKWLISISDYADAQRKLRRANKSDENNGEILNLLFYTLYTLVKNNICEYNIKEAITIAQKAQALGKFEYDSEREELENILKNIQGKN